MPRTCIWEITKHCNLRCIHCDNHSARPVPLELPLPRLFDVADELKALGCELVDVTGGEPLLRPDWDRLCAHLTGIGVEVALVTNGTLLDEEAIQRAVDAGVSTIGVSIDGIKGTHDATRRFVDGSASAFDATVGGIRRTVPHIPVSAITQVNRTNLKELREMGNMLSGLGVTRWQLQLTIPTAKVEAIDHPYLISPADLEPLTAFIVEAADDPTIPMIHTSDTIGYGTRAEAILRRKACGPGLWLGCVAGIRSVAIKYDGMVRGCSLLPAEFDAGSLHESSLAEIWSDSNRFGYTTQFNRSHLGGGCSTCRFGTICRAGCTTMAYFSTGTTGDNPYCLHRVRNARGASRP